MCILWKRFLEDLLIDLGEVNSNLVRLALKEAYYLGHMEPSLGRSGSAGVAPSTSDEIEAAKMDKDTANLKCQHDA